jgi:hypothetical protein
LFVKINRTKITNNNSDVPSGNHAVEEFPACNSKIPYTKLARKAVMLMK